MDKWDKQKLKEMTKIQNEFTKIKLDYVKIAYKYPEILKKTYENGDVIPLVFKDVEVTYNGKILEDIELPSISEETQKLIEQKEQEQNVMHIKHFSRSISHQAWFDYLDEEIEIFLKKYPEYKEIKI